ncbi:MAG: hypothetical protein HQL77_13815, partial [Magnetococcales bacterium]|nr:hypothetical protein [Magnetococcales bacterium]
FEEEKKIPLAFSSRWCSYSSGPVLAVNATAKIIDNVPVRVIGSITDSMRIALKKIAGERPPTNTIPLLINIISFFQFVSLYNINISINIAAAITVTHKEIIPRLTKKTEFFTCFVCKIINPRANMVKNNIVIVII